MAGKVEFSQALFDKFGVIIGYPVFRDAPCPYADLFVVAVMAFELDRTKPRIEDLRAEPLLK